MLEKIKKLFENFNSHTDDYLGAMFINLFGITPLCYRIFYDNDSEKLIYRSCIEAFEDIKFSLNFKIDSRKIVLNYLKFVNDNNDPNYRIFCYSQHEYLLLANTESSGLLMNITLDDSNDSSENFEEIFTNNIDWAYNFISKFVEKAENKINIDFGIVSLNMNNALYTSYYDYKPIDIDIDKNYNDDFKKPYDKICELIEEEEKSHLMLFYGDPGTGKSSIIKHLIGKYPDKNFIFMDGSLLASTSQDKLMGYFLDNPDTIFILEDCEKILMNREHYNNQIMPVLLNLTDGIISDVLSIKFICTFNTSLSNIDPALRRKGRMSLKYEFKKLSKEKCQAIVDSSDKFKEKFIVNEDMSLADLYNIDDENDYSKKNTKKIGF